MTLSGTPRQAATVLPTGRESVLPLPAVLAAVPFSTAQPLGRSERTSRSFLACAVEEFDAPADAMNVSWQSPKAARVTVTNAFRADMAKTLPRCDRK